MGTSKNGRASDCCLRPTRQFFIYIIVRTSSFSMRWWRSPPCTRPTLFSWIFIVLAHWINSTRNMKFNNCHDVLKEINFCFVSHMANILKLFRRFYLWLFSSIIRNNLQFIIPPRYNWHNVESGVKHQNHSHFMIHDYVLINLNHVCSVICWIKYLYISKW